MVNEKTLLIFLLVVFLLPGCQTTTTTMTPSPSVQIIEKPVFPVLNEYKIPEEPELIPFVVDMPRDTTKRTVKNVTECVSVKEEKRNEEFWKKCGEHPIITDSNIYVGFDLENWNNLQSNFFRLREYINTLKSIIKEINFRISEIKQSEKEETEKFNKEYEEFRKKLDLK